MHRRVAKIHAVVASLLMAWNFSALSAPLGFVTVDAAPWAYHDEAGRPAGALPEIVAELERRGRQRISLSLFPLVRIDRAMETGEQDCTVIFWNDARARLVVRGEDVYPMPFGVVARRGVPLARYEDLVPLAISVTRGLSMFSRFDTDPGLRKDAEKDYLTGLRKLARGRVDAVAGALPTLRHIAERAGLMDRLGSSLVLSHVPLSLQCSRRSGAVKRMAALNEALLAMKADGSLARILTAYGYR